MARCFTQDELQLLRGRSFCRRERASGRPRSAALENESSRNILHLPVPPPLHRAVKSHGGLLRKAAIKSIGRETRNAQRITTYDRERETARGTRRFFIEDFSRKSLPLFCLFLSLSSKQKIHPAAPPLSRFNEDLHAPP